MSYAEINKEMAINEGYRDLAQAIIENGIKAEGDEYFYSDSGQLWKKVFIAFDEGVQGLTTDSPLGHVTNQYMD
tara:strand:+ start:913 stop:1134 length:222 start_codon:yes stop_codon:yes gene_type:complete